MTIEERDQAVRSLLAGSCLSAAAAFIIVLLIVYLRYRK